MISIRPAKKYSLFSLPCREYTAFNKKWQSLYLPRQARADSRMERGRPRPRVAIHNQRNARTLASALLIAKFLNRPCLTAKRAGPFIHRTKHNQATQFRRAGERITVNC